MYDLIRYLKYRLNNFVALRHHRNLLREYVSDLNSGVVRPDLLKEQLILIGALKTSAQHRQQLRYAALKMIGREEFLVSQGFPQLEAKKPNGAANV